MSLSESGIHSPWLFEQRRQFITIPWYTIITYLLRCEQTPVSPTGSAVLGRSHSLSISHVSNTSFKSHWKAKAMDGCVTSISFDFICCVFPASLPSSVAPLFTIQCGWFTLWQYKIAMENDHRHSGFSHEKWWLPQLFACLPEGKRRQPRLSREGRFSTLFLKGGSFPGVVGEAAAMHRAGWLDVTCPTASYFGMFIMFNGCMISITTPAPQ